MIKVYKHRLYPTKRQERILSRWLYICCVLYNYLLDLAIKDYKFGNSYRGRFGFSAIVTMLGLAWEEAPCRILQDVCTRIDFAFKNFFRHCKKGNKRGFPRFRSSDRYDSMTIVHNVKVCESGNRVKLPKVGIIKFVSSQVMTGKIKGCTVKRTPTGKWFVSFVCEVEKIIQKKPVVNIVGCDAGLTTLLTLSDGNKIKRSRFLKAFEDKLAKTQQKFSKNRNPKTKKQVARIYEKVSNQRHDYLHKVSRSLVEQYDVICFEDLNIDEMMSKGWKSMHRSISDAAWNSLIHKTTYKAEEAGKRVVLVDPRYTSKACNACGFVNRDLKLSDRTFKCPQCQHEMDRDLNAAKNILRLGLQSLAKT